MGIETSEWMVSCGHLDHRNAQATLTVWRRRRVVVMVVVVVVVVVTMVAVVIGSELVGVKV